MTRRVLRRRVLLIDNDPPFLETRKEALEEAGFEVLTAASLEEARAILRRCYVHLAAIDVRMIDDESDRDRSGLKLAREAEFAEVVKIMMTGYERDPDDVNDIVATPEPGIPPPALRYVNKIKGQQEMVKWFDWATDFCGINWTLDLDPPYAMMADLAARLGGAPRDEWNDRGDELTDLLAMAFFAYDRARIDRLLWHYDQRLALAVTAVRGDHSDQRIVVITNRAAAASATNRIIPERAPEGFAQFVKPTRALRTLHYAVELYELPEARLDETATLRTFFQTTTRPAVLADLVRRLVLVSLRPLGQAELPRDDAHHDDLLRARAGLLPAAADALRRRLAEVGVVVARHGVAVLRLADGQFSIRLDDGPHFDLSNPADWLARPGPADFAHPPRLGETVGVPPAETILVHPDGRFWLTDFSQQQRGPLLANLADLEAQVMLDLYPAPNPVQFADAQRRLVRPCDLSERVEGITPEMKKAFIVIREIRDEAARLGADPEAYFRALFYHSAQRLLAMPLDATGRDEALALLNAALSLGLLAERLGDGAVVIEAQPPRRPGLWIDEPSGRCWLDDVLLPPLAPTPFRFLLYLWHHPRQRCAIADIINDGLGGNFDDNYPDVLAGKVRQALGPQATRYLVSYRGGYILYPDGQNDQPL